MYFDEFAAIYNAYATQRDSDLRDRWQRMRMLATICIQPYTSKNKQITPEKLLPLPWDKEKKPKRADEPKLTVEERRERMRKLVQKLGEKL